MNFNHSPPMAFKINTAILNNFYSLVILEFFNCTTNI